MQVKFRGKRVDGQGWVEGNLIIADSISCKDYYIRLQSWDDVHGYLTYPVIPESVGMFTGLTDKNGKEIYGAVGENGGDIVGLSRVGMDDECVGVVDYDNDVASFVVNKRNGGFEFLCKELQLNMALKIIGNVFDNPELLEK